MHLDVKLVGNMLEQHFVYSMVSSISESRAILVLERCLVATSS